MIVSNWLFAVACLASPSGDITAQKLAARYFFSQFWAEFTIEVLQDFHDEDVAYRKELAAIQAGAPPDLKKLSAAGQAKTTPLEHPLIAAIFKQETRNDFKAKQSIRNTKSD